MADEKERAAEPKPRGKSEPAEPEQPEVVEATEEESAHTPPDPDVYDEQGRLKEPETS